MSAIAIAVFAALALIGAPLAFAIGLGAVIALYLGDFDLVVLPQRMMFAVNSFPLMAIPLFMLAGELMVKAGIVDRLIGFANSLVGRVHGGVAHVTILAGTVFASVSGAAVASASALGSTLVPALRKSYPDGFSSAVVASAANLGPVIPPSNAMIVYALMAGSSVSVGGMFMAGIVPGLILTLGFMALASFIARRRGYPLSGEPFSGRRALTETRRAGLILLMPVIVVGGIVGGIFTATEGAAIAVVYALAVGLFVTRKLKIADLPGCLFRAAMLAAMVGALIAFASVMTFVFTLDLVPLRLSAFIEGVTSDPMVFIAIVMAMLLVVGMLIEFERRLHHAGAAVRADGAELRDRPALLRFPVYVQPRGGHDDAARRRAAVRDERYHPGADGPADDGGAALRCPAVRRARPVRGVSAGRAVVAGPVRVLRGGLR